MYNDSSGATGQQFVEGTTVYDVNGEKVGTVSEHNVQGSYLVVHKGWLFPKDVYIPLSDIGRNDADGVYLRLDKDQLKDQNYDAPPVGGTGTVGTTTDVNAASYAGTTTGSGTAYQDQSINAVDTGATYQDQTGTNATNAEDIRVPVMEEELVVGKRAEEIGHVHLHKDVIEEQQTITEPVMREEVHVERVPLQGQADTSGVTADAFTEQDIDVPVMGEELVTEKRAVVAEEVRLRKEAITEQEQVSDTVRKERVTVEGADEAIGTDEQYNRNT